MTHLYQKSYAIWLAIVSFVIGTFLFLGYFLFDYPDKDRVIITGLFYTLFALIINAITFIYLLFQYFKHPVKRDLIVIEGFFLLCNIPIAILYFYIILTNFNTYQLF